MTELHKNSLVVAVMLGLGLVVVWLGVNNYQQNQDIKRSEKIESQLDQLLLGYEAGVEGKSCGVLNTQQAYSLLGVEAVKDTISSRQRAGGTSESSSDNPRLYWSDSCIYEDKQNSNRYIELHIATYQTEHEAQQEFENVLPIVNEAIELAPDEFSQESVYDAGVIYALRGRNIFQVSASNARPEQAQQFAEQVYGQLMVHIK